MASPKQAFILRIATCNCIHVNILTLKSLEVNSAGLEAFRIIRSFINGQRVFFQSSGIVEKGGKFRGGLPAVLGG